RCYSERVRHRSSLHASKVVPDDAVGPWRMLHCGAAGSTAGPSQHAGHGIIADAAPVVTSLPDSAAGTGWPLAGQWAEAIAGGPWSSAGGLEGEQTSGQRETRTRRSPPGGELCVASPTGLNHPAAGVPER